MTELEAALIADTITADLVWRVDGGAADQVMSLFAENAQARMNDQIIPRAILEARFAARTEVLYRTRHALSNRRLLNVSAKQITASYLVTIFRVKPLDGATSRTSSIADWTLDIRRETDGWRISEIIFAPFDEDR